MSNFDYDVIVIGGGPAGSKCAIDLGRAGKRVALIEKYAIGGVCLNRGCIPSKSYLYLTELLSNIKKAKRHGIEVEEPKVIWEQARKRKDMNVKMLGMGLTKNIEAAGVELISAEGILLDANTVELRGSNAASNLNDEEDFAKEQENEQEPAQISAEKIVLALGSKPLFFPFIKKGEHVISAKELLDIDEIPQSLAIIGGGVTGVEMASVFSELGTKVTIIELQDSLLAQQDSDISEQLKKSLSKSGCDILLQHKVTNCEDKNNGAEVKYETPDGSEETLQVSKVLVVIGRTTTYDLEALGKIGIENDGRRVLLNDKLQTSQENIYMIGDSAWRNLTAYGAEREAEVVAAHILGHERAINYDQILVTVFSHPEIGSIGMTEEGAKENGIEYEVLKSEYAANAKAIIMGEREGFAKIIIEKGSERILGVHLIGVHAADLIHQALIPVAKGMTRKEWLEIIWSHPVLSEVLKGALES